MGDPVRPECLGTGDAGDIIEENGFWPTGEMIYYCE